MKTTLFSLLLLAASIMPNLTFSQFTQQGLKLVGTGAVGDAIQGYSVAISSDGNSFVEGGYHDNGQTGAIWVFTRSGGVWTQQGSKLVGTGAVGSFVAQGISVTISSDGNTLVEGGCGDNNNAGGIWVFTRNGGVWTQQGSKLVGTGGIGDDWQGFSVALSSDGNTFVEGGFYDNNDAGAVWIFTRSGGLWTQQGQKLVGAGAAGGAKQGWSVAISSDGNTLVEGGYVDNGGQGAVWVFTRSGGVWTQQGSKLVGTGAVGSDVFQGIAVSISSDGNTLIEGGDDNNGAGAVWVFTRSGGVWTQQGSKLVGTGAVGGATQGNSVAISPDGNTIVEGGNEDNYGQGAVWAFTRSGGVWTQLGSKLVGTGAVGTEVLQGFAVSISSEGTVAEGGDGDNSAGAVWVFHDPTIGIKNISQTIPSTYSLSQNYPNPFNPSTNIGFRIVHFGLVTLRIYDLLGREVATLINEAISPGTYEYEWNATNLSSGVYFYRITTGYFTDVKKMTLLK